MLRRWAVAVPDVERELPDAVRLPPINVQPLAAGNSTIPVTQRVILNYFTAKRMLAALQMTGIQALHRSRRKEHTEALGLLRAKRTQRKIRVPLDAVGTVPCGLCVANQITAFHVYCAGFTEEWRGKTTYKP